jgi:hypothetical protein
LPESFHYRYTDWDLEPVYSPPPADDMWEDSITAADFPPPQPAAEPDPLDAPEFQALRILQARAQQAVREEDSLTQARHRADQAARDREAINARTIETVAILAQTYHDLGMVGGVSCQTNRFYVVITEAEADRYHLPPTVRFNPNAVLPSPPTCSVCSAIVPNSESDRCDNCTRRQTETVEAIEHGGRRFGIELEFSLGDGYYIDDDEDYDDDPDCDCADCRERANRTAARRRRTRRENQLTPEFIAEAITEAGVPCISPGYTHAIFPGSWKIVPDGSLQNGYELVSPPIQWEVAREQVTTACEVLSRLGCESTSDCGLHVHHDVGDLNVERATLLAHNWNTCQSQSDRLVDPYRINSEWCYPGPSNLIASQCNYSGEVLHHFLGIDGERYRPLNWTCWFNYGTVEVRMHESTLVADEILAWVAYTQSIIEASMYGKRIEPPTSIDHLLDEQLVIRRAARPSTTRALLKRKARANVSVPSRSTQDERW